MKSFKKLLLVLCLLLGIGMLCSCKKLETMTIHTQLNISSNFDGERIMTTTMPKSVLDYLFDGNVATLRSVIEKYCPKDMTCTIDARDQDINIIMTIPFASFTEYKTKVYTILVNDRNPRKDLVNPTVYYDSADTLFKEGVTLEESFTSMDMMYWIPLAIQSEFPEYEDEDLSGLFVEGTTTLNINGQSLPMEGKISFSNMESCAFSAAKVYLNIDENESKYECQVELIVDRDNYEKLKNYKIDDKLKSHINSKMDMTQSLSNAYKTYYISFTTKTAAVCKNYLNKIFDSDDAVIEITNHNGNNGELKSEKYIDFYVNTANYIDFSVPDSEAVYIISINGVYNLESCKSENNYLKKYTLNSVGDQMSVAEIHLSGSDKVSLVLGTDISVDQIDVSTVVYNQKKYTRKINFYLTEDNDALIGENLNSKIESRLLDGMEYQKIRIGDGSFNYEVTMHSESLSALSEMTCAFLDGSAGSAKSKITGGPTDANTIRTVYMTYADRVDFSGFLGSSDVTQGIHYTFTYPKGYKADFDDASEYKNVKSEYNVISCTTFNKVISVASTGQIGNFVGISQLVSWYISLALILVVLLMNLPGIIRSVKARHVDWIDLGLFRKRGYVYATLLVIALVIFIITSIRLIFKVY